MSIHDFIIDGIRFSYSSTSTYDNCPYSFKLTYIDALTPRKSNFFGEFGNLTHSCFEEFFNKKLEAFELSQYYRNNYNSVIKTPAPSSPPGLEEKYREQGQTFFDGFSFDIENYEVLLVEEPVDFELDNIKLVAKPDLVLMDKRNGDFILYDYKTATPYWEDKRTGKEKQDAKRINGYYQQMYIYTYALRNFGKFIPIDKITIWYVRLGKTVTIPWVLDEENKAITKLSATIEKIKNDETFPYNNSNSYFCNELCGVRAFCEYR